MPAVFQSGFADKDWLQVDDSPTSPYAHALYISTTQQGPGSSSAIAVSHSNDSSATWQTVLVDTQQQYPTVEQWSDLAIGKDGAVYVSWLRCTVINGSCEHLPSLFYVSRSTDSGSTWSAPVLMAKGTLPPDTCGWLFGCLPNTQERVSFIPAIDIDNGTGKYAGHLYTVIDTWTGTYLKVEVITSTDGGISWSKPARVTPKRNTHDQFFPWLSVNREGIVGVTWMDRRDDPNNILYREYAAVSKDGQTYKGNVAIASQPSDPRIDQIGFMGDYAGNIWSGDTLFASWMDSRKGVNMQDEIGGYRTK